MQLLIRVLLHLLDILSKFAGVLEFSFDEKRKKFVRSSFWKWYLWTMQLVFILPASCFGLYKLCIAVVTSNRVSKNFNVFFKWASSWALGCSIIGISCLVMKSKRRLLQRVLNQLVSLGRIHHELFGKGIKIRLLDYAQIVRDLNSNWWTGSDNSWLNLYLVFSWCHCLLQIFLTDITLTVNIYHLNSLALCLNERLECSPAKRSLYLRYYRKLLDLSRNLQQLWWPVHISTLTFEVIYYIQLGLNEYVDNMQGAAMGIFVSSFLDSNAIYLYKTTREIHRFENRILDDLFELEVLLWDKETHGTRNLRLVQMEQMLLMRGTLQESSATVCNCFYRRSSLIFDAAKFIFVLYFLQMNFIHHKRHFPSVTNSSL